MSENVTVPLSLETLDIMKNFATINPSIYIRGGDVLTTLAISNKIMGKAKVTETFPCDIPIYDLPKFLNQLKLYSEPVMDVNADEKFLTIRDDDPEKQEASTKWTFSDPATIHKPDKMLPVPEPDILFELSQHHLQSILKSSGILGFETLVLKRENDDHISISVVNMDKMNGTQYKITIPATFNGDFKTIEIVFKTELLKIQDRSFSIALSKKMYSHWHSEDVEYFIAIDKRSKFV